MAASPRPLLLSRHLSSSSSPRSLSPLLLSRHLLPLRRSTTPRTTTIATACLVSDVDGGGGVADEFTTSTRSDPGARREFSALASVLRRIEPLDTSVIGKGVSAPARDSMKRTISTMLGLLPSDQFRVSVRVSNHPLRHLLVSSIITGYTLWNAEYRVALMRNFDSSPGDAEVAVATSGEVEVIEEEVCGREDEDGDGDVGCCVEKRAGACLGELSPAASSYIQELEFQLATVDKELDDQKHEYIHLEHNKEEDNDLLKYLRSLEPDMVSELSQPSSSEVEEIIQQLVQSIHMRYFNDESPDFSQDLNNGKSGDHGKDVNHHDATIVTTRDYLAKLLFWCMLLGHHLRGLEHRLHLSCVVGLL